MLYSDGDIYSMHLKQHSSHLNQYQSKWIMQKNKQKHVTIEQELKSKVIKERIFIEVQQI